MEGVFVGVLFAIGVFLYFYEGYKPDDNRARFEVLSDNAVGNIACICALGVALFPTNSGVALVRYLHVIFATAMFLILAYFSLVLFTKGSQNPTERKERRNRVYHICGVTILVCIALIGVVGWFLPEDALEALNPVFWLEAIALWAFGAAWFVKGEGILTDGQRPGVTPPR